MNGKGKRTKNQAVNSNSMVNVLSQEELIEGWLPFRRYESIDLTGSGDKGKIQEER